MKFSLGAIQYFWDVEQVNRFYLEAAESPVDIVYLGETVCPKRREYGFENYLNTAHMLREAGKEVVLSTLTLLESPADLRELRKICDNGDFVIEANDMGAVELLSEKKLPFVGGAALNCYNAAALNVLMNAGMQRLVLPVEFHRSWYLALLEELDVLGIRQKIEFELLGFGYLPLAWSARCFTARAENLPKDKCQKCCSKYPEGRLVKSQEGDSVFVLNGIQTQSGHRQNLLNEVPELVEMLDVLRLSPQTNETFQWLDMFRDKGSAKRGAVGTSEGRYILSKDECNGYWHGQAGMLRNVESC